MNIDIFINEAHSHGIHSPIIAYDPEVNISTEIDEPLNVRVIKKLKTKLTEVIREGIDEAMKEYRK